MTYIVWKVHTLRVLLGPVVVEHNGVSNGNIKDAKMAGN